MAAGSSTWSGNRLASGGSRDDDGESGTDRHGAGQVEADPHLNSSDRPETDQPGAKAAADPTAAVSMRRNRNPSAETQRLYAADWRAFEDWCREQSQVPLAADATTVAPFLTQGTKTLSAGALSRRPAAIAERHRQTRMSTLVATRTTKPVGRSTRVRRTCFTAADYPVEPVSHATTLFRPVCNGTRPSMPRTLFAKVGAPRECLISPARDGCV